MKKRMNTMYELTEQKKNDISVYGVKYGDLQIDDISTDKGRVKKFVSTLPYSPGWCCCGFCGECVNLTIQR